jgi:hypothetical protein
MATSELDEQSLLLSNRLEKVVYDPFCFFYIDDYLPSDLYRSLLESYPDESRYTYDPEGKMGFRSSEDPEEVERFGTAHPEWQRLVDFFCSDDFVYDARETLSEALVNARGLWGRKPWYNCTRRKVPDNWLRYQLQEPVRTTYQFSLLPRDAAIAPHTDAPRKLVSLLLYFRGAEWEDAWGGGTEFCIPLDPAKARKWGPTDRIPFEEFKTIDTTEFRGNRLAGFVRSANSYHGVRPVACPPGMARKALLINIKRLKWSKRRTL